MKSITMKQTSRHLFQIHSQRRGSTLLVVIALLAILALMAVVFYTFSSQERTSAENFANAAINEADPGLQADVLFNWGLEQLIKGPDPYLKNSALWGGEYPRHSLIHNMLGRDDFTPFNGQGVNVILNGTDGPIVDQDFNGGSDNPSLLNYNDSPSAQLTIKTEGTFEAMPAPDVDYTAPDINNLFLAYKGYIPGLNYASDPSDVETVIIPSFHRPQYLRDSNGNPVSNPYTDSSMAQRVFRPHADHHFFHREGGGSDSGSSRYSTTVFNNSGYTYPGALGVWTTGSSGLGNTTSDYSLDVDNDGDTIREGVWLDLDFPPIEDPQNPGNYIIPMFSFTVYDADGLINLNTAGNMRQPGSVDLNYAASPGEKFGNNLTGTTNQFLLLSRSHQGLSSPSEINPQWALTANVPSPIGTSLDQHYMFFGANPGSWQELSNMEYFFLNFGRAEYTVPGTLDFGTKSDVNDLYSGRWGEPSRLFQAQRNSTSDNIGIVYTSGGTTYSFPRPGQTLVDDNADRYEGSSLSGSLQGARSGAISFKHPLAYNGAGRSWRPGASPNYKRVNLYAATGGPMAWPYYTNYEIAGPDLSNAPNSVRWPAGLFSNGVNVANPGYLVDDADEIVVDMEKVQRPYDEPFGPEEMAHLFLSGTDIDSSGVTSRLSALLPRNFGAANVAEDFDRRKRFTTMSWDRKQFSKPVSSTGINNQFPPPYNTNPFRNELLQLIGTGLSGNLVPEINQLKLNLNQLLVFENTGTGRTISYRPLTPHPGEDMNGNGVLDAGEDLNGNGVLDSLTATAINSGWHKNNTPAYPPNTLEQQEFWARYDRQRMARDIYSILYSLNCFTSPNSSDSYTATEPYPRNYTNEEMRQMAQFAVNVVDALDPDNVMTRFEYDTNLNDGWGLDDNPYTDDVTGQRKVVWGVEAVELTLSEFILVQCDDQMNDLAVTQFPDDKVDGGDRDRFFAGIELRNVSTSKVSLGTHGKWMVGLEVDGAMQSYAVLKKGVVDEGGLFTLLSGSAADTLDPSSSDPYSEMRVDLDGNGDFTDANERIIPLANIAAADKIDFVTDQAGSNSLVTVFDGSFTDITSTVGSFLNQAHSVLSTTPDEVKIKLYRKAHPGRDTYLSTSLPIPDTDNPWVLVDEIAADKSSFNLMDTDTAAAASGQLNNVRSKERSEPLRKNGGEASHAASGPINNTLGRNNSNSPATFSLWQPHFDRDFSSPVELFSVPIIGPATQAPSDANLAASSGLSSLITYSLVDSGGDQAGQEVKVAGIQKFLDPDGVNNTGPDDDDNYWYRLFEYVEVPTRIHRQLANPLKDFRVPGKINLNTVRHPTVLAALLDDMGTTNNVLDAATYSTDVTTNSHQVPRLYDTAEGSSRNWWEQFILSRDGFDPSSGYYLPGTPGSRPFRSFDFFGSRAVPTTGVRDLKENTLFRSLPADRSTHPDDPRHLWEVANRTEHEGGSVDFHTRNRILSKIMGNTTTRSNTFLVFLSVAYFEASGDGLTTPDDLVQIGDRAHGKSVHTADYRGFFVVDRSRIDEAYEPTTKKFDNWKRLVRYRHLIQSIQED